jgi:hypothetical protein
MLVCSTSEKSRFTLLSELIDVHDAPIYVLYARKVHVPQNMAAKADRFTLTLRGIRGLPGLNLHFHHRSCT